MTTSRPPRPRTTRYVLRVDREGLRVELDEHFFNNTIIDAEGTTVLDKNIATLVQEIRAGLYYIGTEGTLH